MPVKKAGLIKMWKRRLANTADQAFGVMDIWKLPVIRAAAMSVMVAAVVIYVVTVRVSILFNLRRICCQKYQVDAEGQASTEG